MNQVPEQLYPFATADGKDIPFDVLKPQGLAVISYDAIDWAPFQAPEGVEVATFFSKNSCLVSFAETPSWVLDEYLPQVLFVPANTIVQAYLPSNSFAVLGTETEAKLYVQFVVRWASLAVPRQFTRK